LQFFCLSCRGGYHPLASKRTNFVINRIISKHKVIVIQYRSSDNDGIPLTEYVYSTQQKVTILNRDLVLMGLPSATLAWYKQPPAMRVCIKSYTKKSPIVLQ
jgi:uncharacterized membrane protein YiaA